MTAAEATPGGEAGSPAGLRRPPVDGECEFCGHTPAVHVMFGSVTSFLVFYTISNRRAWMCRSCGLATYRVLTGRTLARGWWGAGIFGMPVIMIINRVRLRRVLRLGPPQGRLPEVASMVPVPMDPGKPLRSRGSGILAITICVLLALLVLIGVLGS